MGKGKSSGKGVPEPSVADGAWLMEEVMVTKSVVRYAKVKDPPPDWRWKGCGELPKDSGLGGAGRTEQIQEENTVMHH